MKKIFASLGISNKFETILNLSVNQAAQVYTCVKQEESFWFFYDDVQTLETEHCEKNVARNTLAIAFFFNFVQGFYWFRIPLIH